MGIPNRDDHTAAEGPTRRDAGDEEMGDAEVSSTGTGEFAVGWVGENGDDDPDNPRSFSRARKWLASLVVSLGSACV